MTGEQAVTIRDVFADLIEREAPKTRKVIAAVPAANRDYRPDDKSRTAWEVATHLALADIWFLDSIINALFVNPGAMTPPAEMTDAEAVAAWYERHIADRLARLRVLTPGQLLRDTKFANATRPAVSWLTLMNNHSVPHRGQLAAYLRAAGSSVPAIFGASADENAFVPSR